LSSCRKEPRRRRQSRPSTSLAYMLALSFEFE
jgi:hypothetical protein